jgi:hypothetical protein
MLIVLIFIEVEIWQAWAAWPVEILVLSGVLGSVGIRGLFDVLVSVLSGGGELWQVEVLQLLALLHI